MDIICKPATREDVEPIYQWSKWLVDTYEDLTSIPYDRVLQWMHRKIETCLADYSAIYVQGEKAGYFHFFVNQEGAYELDDLYIFPAFQNQGIGSHVIQQCCDSVDAPVILYVFVKNRRALSLYQRLGFEIIETLGTTRYIMQRTPTL